MRIHGYEDSPTGLRTIIGSEADKMVVKYAQDIEPSMERNLAMRNDPEHAKEGIKRSWQHACHIPEVVGLQMMTEDGFNVWQAHPKEIRHFLVRNRDKYGFLFTTAGRI